VSLVGTVERTLVELSAPVSEVIVDIPVQRGTVARAGDVVVRLDPSLAEAELARVEAVIVSARMRVAVAQNDLDRTVDLRRKKIISEDQLEHARLAWQEATALLREAEAQLRVARKRLDDMTVTAPVAGVVDQIPFDLGERVPAGAVVAVLLQDGPAWVRVWIPQRAVSRITPGAKAEVRVDGIAAALPGEVLDVSTEPAFTPHYALTERERVHLVYAARVEIATLEKLRPGSGATVSISLPPLLAGTAQPAG
jgi:HlyD family secretion protein